MLSRGSVISFARGDDAPATQEELKTVREHLDGGIGDHRQDGLGQVILNPGFVLNPPKLVKEPNDVPLKTSMPRPVFVQPNLEAYLQQREVNDKISSEALKLGLQWATQWTPLTNAAAKAAWKGKSGKSQWGEVLNLARAARGDMALLQRDLTDFCTSGLRKKFWDHNGPDRSPWAELGKIFSEKKPLPAGVDDSSKGEFFCTALAVAASEIGRKLQESDSGAGQRPQQRGGIR